MELEQLKNIWKIHDAQLDTDVQVNRELLKTVSLNKVRSLLTSFTINSIIELVFDVIASYFLIRFLVRHFSSDWSFVIPASILLTFIVADIIWHFSKFITLSNIHYKNNILETQKEFQRLKLHQMRERQYLYMAIPTFFPLLLLVVFKGWWDIDLYPYIWTKHALFYMLGSVVVTIIIVWLLKKFPDEKMEEAAQFLEELEEFED